MLKAHQQFEAERAAFVEAEKRLACEGLLDATNHVAGSYDTPMRFAMLAFQRKNVVMAEADITRGTLEALARSPLDNAFLALQPGAGRTRRRRRRLHRGRQQRRRAATLIWGGDGGGDGPAGCADARAGAGVLSPAQPAGLRLAPGGGAVARGAAVLRPAHGSGGRDRSRRRLVRLPVRQQGERLPQPRSRYPSFTLYVSWQGGKDGKKLPLVRWRTTIGSWRTELASDGQEYLRYKDSDVGPRVWRHVVAAPVWVPLRLVAARRDGEGEVGQRGV